MTNPTAPSVPRGYIDVYELGSVCTQCSRFPKCDDDNGGDIGRCRAFEMLDHLRDCANCRYISGEDEFCHADPGSPRKSNLFGCRHWKQASFLVVTTGSGDYDPRFCTQDEAEFGFEKSEALGYRVFRWGRFDYPPSHELLTVLRSKAAAGDERCAELLRAHGAL